MRKGSCPWCGRPMASGELVSERFINWEPDEAETPSLRELLSWEGFKELCAPLTGNIQIPDGDDWKNAHGQIPAWHCPDCQVFLFKGKVK